MARTTLTLVVVGVAALGAVAIASKSVIAQAPATCGVGQSADVVGTLEENDAYFIDGKTFAIVRGKAKGDAASKIAALNAHEVGPGAIVFRSGGKLYIGDTGGMASPQAMKDFQDKWAVSYMNAAKEFQDRWAVSYMKDPKNSNVSASGMKDFQDKWAVSYMNANKEFQDSWRSNMKNFQDDWAVSYMKNFQDQWAVSYIKQKQGFQDHWATAYK